MQTILFPVTIRVRETDALICVYPPVIPTYFYVLRNNLRKQPDDMLEIGSDVARRKEIKLEVDANGVRN